MSGRTLAQYTTSNLIRQKNHTKVYEVIAVPNADTGIKHWVNITKTQFIAVGFDSDSIYEVNDIEGSNEFYRTGYQRTVAHYPQLKRFTQSNKSGTAQKQDNNKDHITVFSPSSSHSRTPQTDKPSTASGISGISIIKTQRKSSSGGAQPQPTIQPTCLLYTSPSPRD